MSHDATLAIDSGGTVADDHFNGVTNNGSGVSCGAAQVNNTNQQTQKKPGLLDRLKSFGNGVKQYTGNFIAELRPAYTRNADNIQTTLDVAGMVPVIGEPADLLNGAISAGRGNYAEAGLSAAAAVPFIGGVATGTKWSRKVLDGADVLADVAKKGTQQTNRVLHATDEMLDMLKNGGRIEVPPGQTGIRTLMSDMTVGADGREVLLFRAEDGKRYIVMGPEVPPGTKARVTVPGDVKTPIAHTHPTGNIELSPDDIKLLQNNGMRSHVIIDPFTTKGARLPVPPK